jgi:hypothetical protein
MTAVTIPPEVLDDVAAWRGAYRPIVLRGQPVLARVRGGGWIQGTMSRLDGDRARVFRSELAVPDAPMGSAVETCDAWLAVGSVDGGPRPEVGARVLVLDGTRPGRVARCANPGSAHTTIEVEDPQSGGGVSDATRWALLPDATEPEPAQDAPSAPLPATATPVTEPAEHECTPDRVCRVCGGPGRLAAESPDVGDVVERIQRAAAADERGPYVPIPEAVIGDRAWLRRGPAIRLTADEEARWRAGEPTFGDMLGAMERQRDDADPIPPGRWRQGSHAPRNLWVGGAYPEGVDVGRMDTPELAAYVVEAVNARARHDRDLEAARRHADQLGAGRIVAEGERRDALRERGDALAEVARLRARVAELEEAEEDRRIADIEMAEQMEREP